MSTPDLSSPVPKPLLTESSTSESTTVEVAMGDLADGTLSIPDYQRDADQWDAATKSLLIESVINNLTIPAFFFEVSYVDAVERNSVVDGQQRLTTLQEFWNKKLRLVKSDEAPYLSPQSVHYAGKTFDELPLPYQQAFKKYRLTVIKLRDLGPLRLETFRRINRGGEPLSGQDIRLAYYGEGSPSVQFVRLAGIYDKERPGARRFLDGGLKQFDLAFPWGEAAYETWNDFWEGRAIARGQTPSEMFLWSLVAAHVEQLDQLLANSDALATLRFAYDRSIDSALDAFCAQLQYQDHHPGIHQLIAPSEEIRTKFFPHFASWIHTLLSSKGPSISVTKHRLVAAVVGVSYRLGVGPSQVATSMWGDIVELIRSPKVSTQVLGIDLPTSKGRWDGNRGYRAQLVAIREAVDRITHGSAKTS